MVFVEQWKETATRPGDPSLSSLGHVQARETGRFLDSVLAAEGISAKNVILLSSPFLRCVQTSNEILSQFRETSGDVAETVSIKPENSIFEFDRNGWGKYHQDLPTLSERKCYFPRLDENHSSLFEPSLPESAEAFLQRCEKAIVQLNQSYPYDENGPDKVVILVTHAAGCVGLAKAASGKQLQDVNASPPCGIYRLTRTTNGEIWDMDHFAKENGMNAYCKHITDMGESTIPWNHFGPKDVNDGYSGPAPLRN